jgi:4-carboxymuconolactone decarboxylase
MRFQAMSRLPPIPEQNLTDEQRALMHALLSGPRGIIEGPFIPLLRNPGFASRVEKVGEYLRFGGLLPAELRELAILVVSQEWQSPFEWYAHAPIAQKTGVPQSVIDSVGTGRRPENAEAAMLAVYDFVTMLLRQRAVTDDVYQRARECLGEAGVIELTGLCGYYALLAMILNVSETGAPKDGRIPFDLPRASDGASAPKGG